MPPTTTRRNSASHNSARLNSLRWRRRSVGGRGPCAGTRPIIFQRVFCLRCGSAMALRFLDGRMRRACPACGYVHYENPVPAAGVLIEHNGQLALIQRGHAPHAGEWALPSRYFSPRRRRGRRDPLCGLCDSAVISTAPSSCSSARPPARSRWCTHRHLSSTPAACGSCPPQAACRWRSGRPASRS